MKRSAVSEYLIFTYRGEDTTQPDSFWLPTKDIAQGSKTVNPLPTLHKLRDMGLVRSKEAKQKDPKTKHVTPILVWQLAVSWEEFFEAYCKYLERGRTKGGRSNG